MRLLRASALLVLTILSMPYGVFPAPKAQTTSPSFSFGASGDFGSLTAGTSVTSLKLLQSVNPDFFLGLGDLSYDPTVTGDIWCSQFKSYYNGIQIIPGDHDTGGHLPSFGETHSYERYVSGCSLTLGVTPVCGPVAGDCYGKEYYFDYPAANPIARFIFASPKIYNMTGVCTSSPNCSSQTGQPCTNQYGCWQYEANDIHFNWTANAIDDAHAKGIQWVIVATHKVCLSSADATCSMGLSFFNMLIRKKVDLIIQAHDNAYERSKQIALNPYSCPSFPTNGEGFPVFNYSGEPLYNSGCVVDQGLGNYTRGAGTVVVAQGAWVNDLYSVNQSATHPADVAEAPYFARLMGKNTPGAGLGFVKYTVSASSIDVQTYFTQIVAGNAFSDKFSIGTGLYPVASWSPQSPAVGQQVTFTAAATGGVGPYSFMWDFGDGDTALGTQVSHVYVSERAFNVTLTATDSSNKVASSRRIIGVGSWNGAVACNPFQTTIENVIGKISINRVQGDSSTAGADYSGGGFELAGSQPYGASPPSWPFIKRVLQPLCIVNGISSFVELHNVTLTVAPSVATFDCRTAYDQSNGAGVFPNKKNCDVVFSVGNASATSCPACYMHRIYGEIDGDWNASGTAPTAPPGSGQMVDVQGFVFWDPDPTAFNAPTHNWSGWELHPFTAWRVSRAPLAATVTVSPSSPSTGQQVSFTASVSGGTGPYSLVWDFGDGTVTTGTSASHVYRAGGSIIAHVAVTDSFGANGVASKSIVIRDPIGVVLSAYPTIGVAGQPVAFRATVTGGTTPYSFSWNFGDGIGSVSNPASHVFLSNGTRTVALTVTDSSSLSSTATLVYEVGFVFAWKTINQDPGLAVSTPTVCNDQSSSSSFTMWHPSVFNLTNIANNCASISGGVFHARQDNVASPGWALLDDAVIQQGGFTWQGECGHIDGTTPNWACPRNTYGLAYPYITDYDASLTVGNVALNSRNGIGEYNIFIGFYYWLPANVTCNGVAKSQGWLEFQVRLAMYRTGANKPVGTTEVFDPGDDCGYGYTAATLSPGGSVSLNNFDLRSFYQGGLSTLGLPSNTKAILAGIEIGTEGWGVTLPTDFSGITIQAFEPNSLGADVDFDGSVTNSDVALVQSFVGACPTSTYGTYQWRVNSNATNPCIDANDVALVQSFNTTTIPGRFTGSLVAVVVGTDGQLYSSRLTSSWSSWVPLGRSSPSPPTICPSTGGRVDLVVRGMDNMIYHQSFLNNAWSGVWDTDGGATLDRPACVVTNGVLNIVVRGTDDGTWYNNMTLSTGAWSGWSRLGQGATLSSPSLVTDSSGTMYLVVRGTDNGVWHNSKPSGGSWTGWETLGGATFNSTAIAADSNFLDVVVRGTDNGIWLDSLSLSSHSWSGWSLVGGATLSTPSLAIDSAGTLHLVVRGTDNGVWHNSKSLSGSWTGWDSPGGTTLAQVSFAVLGTNLYVAVQGTDSAPWVNSKPLASGLWAPWTSLAGGLSLAPALVSTMA